ncbi:MAG: hypothetical protein K6E47_07585 [Lachnospiraceae bacterium]|nr:hypothetical protein [Lachnospiraceae bacterium]
MTELDLLDAIGSIDKKYVEDANVNDSITKNSAKKKTIIKWVALAACLCVVAALGIILAVHFAGDKEGINEKIGQMASATDKVSDSKESESGDGKLGYYSEKYNRDDPDAYIEDGTDARVTPAPDMQIIEGLKVPALSVPEPKEWAMCDMIGTLVYKGGIYTQSDNMYMDMEAEQKEALLGEYLGHATSSLDEWSSFEEYSKEFASTYEGDVYSVKGYDPQFRVCVRCEAEYDGEKHLSLFFLERLNDITINSGYDVFEARLRVREKYVSCKWESHDDWDYARNIYHDLELDDETWGRFMDMVDTCKFVYTWNPDTNSSSIYRTDNQVHLYIQLDDGLEVHMRLIEGGYVGYQGLGWYFVKIPEDIFNKVFEACR